MGNVILGLLLLGPNTIYGLNQAFAQGISLFYRASLGGLSSALTKLLAAELVTVEAGVEGGRARKAYTITEAGRRTFDAWIRSPITEADAETAALSRLFFLGHIEDPRDRAAILDSIADRLAQDAALLETVARSAGQETVPESLEVVARYRMATLEYGLRSHATALDYIRALAAEARGDD